MVLYGYGQIVTGYGRSLAICSVISVYISVMCSVGGNRDMSVYDTTTMFEEIDIDSGLGPSDHTVTIIIK